MVVIRKGGCWDNEVNETLFGSSKVERLRGMRFATCHSAEGEVNSGLSMQRDAQRPSLAYLGQM